MSAFDLQADAFGRWQVRLDDGSVHEGVSVVRAFPVGEPERGLSILNAQGRELLWIDDLAALPAAQQEALRTAVGQREFMPEILRLDSVSSFVAPCTWQVQTNRGPTAFVLKGEEDIRRLSGRTLIVADAHGVQFLIRDLPALDRHSRKLLDRFL